MNPTEKNKTIEEKNQSVDTVEVGEEAGVDEAGGLRAAVAVEDAEVGGGG